MLKFVMTCGACPEQYDAFLDGKKVGYLRLRHGRFSVEYPYGSDTEVYVASPEGDGMFDDDERDFHLGLAARAILRWHAGAPYVSDDFIGDLIAGKAALKDVEHYVDRWHATSVGTLREFLGLDEEEWDVFARTGEVVWGKRYEVVEE